MYTQFVSSGTKLKRMTNVSMELFVMKLNLNIDKFNTQILRYILSIYTVYYYTQSNDFVVYIFLYDENKYVFIELIRITSK